MSESGPNERRRVKTVDVIYRYEAHESPARPLPEDSDAAISRLDDGNRAFAALLERVQDESGHIEHVIPVEPHDLGIFANTTVAPKHRPFAAVVGCADARAPVELVFNEGPNNLFVIRVAGNGPGTDALGSLKYAVEHLDSLKLIVVLGHSGCGALTAAVDLFLNPGDYLALANKPSLRTMLDRMLLVVQTCANKLLATFGPQLAQTAGYRKALIEASIVTNAALSAYSIQQELGIGENRSLRVVYGVYLLETHAIWTPRLGSKTGGGLAAAPKDLAGFVELGNALVESERIVSLVRADDA
jgi:carbonic anhydrase